MQVKCKWLDKMKFETTVDGHSVLIDAKSPIGNDSGPSPKSLVLVAICGCTAMDVMALMKKHKQPVEEFIIDSESDVSDKHPKVFTEVRLSYSLKGQIDKEKVMEAIKLSQTQYCGVSAMIARNCPINYKVILNGETIGQGSADF